MAKRNAFLPSAPGRNLWIAAVLLGGLGVLSHFVHLGDLSLYNYWLLLIGFFLLVAGTSYRNV